jgi:hypothetical protein
MWNYAPLIAAEIIARWPRSTWFLARAAERKLV